MTKFIFEDNENTPSSVLLRHCYNGHNILFSKSGQPSAILRKLLECKEENDSIEIIIFYDLPPNNEYVCANYDILTAEIMERGYTDVYVIPIVCIEYYILRFLLKYGYLHCKDKYKKLIASLIFSFDYQDAEVQKFISKNNYRKESLEHIYKELLSMLTITSRCMINSFDYVDDNSNIRTASINGKFYEENCDCESKYCKSSSKDSLRLKAERFYTSLPVFEIVNEEHFTLLRKVGIKIKTKDLKEVYDERCLFFKLVCESMQIEVPFIVRFDT